MYELTKCSFVTTTNIGCFLKLVLEERNYEFRKQDFEDIYI